MDNNNEHEYPHQKFSLGRVVLTPNAGAELTAIEVAKAVACHARGEWGNLCDEDRAQNERALQGSGRLFSSYQSGRGITFWIITEADRSVTSILLPIEY